MGVDKPLVTVRDFILGEAADLRDVFMSSVHGLARRFYTEEQIKAWAPVTHDEGQWADRIAALRPFVATVDGRVAGYADLQESGYIDHFFVAAEFSGQGVGSLLMQRIHEAASQRHIAVLFADVSLTAEAFFQHRGFAVVSCQSVIRKDVAIPNARMTKQLLKEPQEPGYGGDHAEHEAFQRLRTELANAYAAPEASYQTLAAADVIARNRT